MTFKQGDKVRYRQGVIGAAAPPDRRGQLGEVVAVTDLRGVANGMRITVQWSDGGKSEGVDANLFEIA